MLADGTLSRVLVLLDQQIAAVGAWLGQRTLPTGEVTFGIA